MSIVVGVWWLMCQEGVMKGRTRKIETDAQYIGNPMIPMSQTSAREPVLLALEQNIQSALVEGILQ
jgi:hypothetical protein